MKVLFTLILLFLFACSEKKADASSDYDEPKMEMTEMATDSMPSDSTAHDMDKEADHKEDGDSDGHDSDEEKKDGGDEDKDKDKE